jgi:cytochrome oxidase Cu insertion factor (SCO1/SenC/PrrC family)
LAQVWKAYGIAAQIEPDGSMIGHSEIAYVIDSHGQLRQAINFDPGPATAATQSSFAAELTDAARPLLSQP